LVLRRRPLDLVVGVQERLPQLVAADEPVVDDAEDERCLAAPADRVAVDDRAGLGEEASLAERRDDRLGGLVGREALEGAVAGQPVGGVWMDGGRDVRGERPRRRRPDGQRLALATLQREAHVERRVLELLVVLLAGLLVLRERGAAAGAPLGRSVALVEPA